MTLRVVTAGAGGDRAWEVEGDASTVTVGQVARAVGLRAGTSALLVDGRPVAAHATAADAALAQGARLQLPGTAVTAEAPEGPAAWLHHVAGLGAGRAVALAPGRYAIGPALSGAAGLHAGPVATTSTVAEVADDGADGADRVDRADRWLETPGAVFQLTTALPPTVRRRPPDERGLVVLHRPPRPPAAPAVEPPPAATPPAAPRPPAPLSWVTLLGPLPVVAAMALLLSPRFALLGVAGPVLALGRWAEGRLRYRRHRRRHAVATVAARAEQAAALRVAAEAERARRWGEHPAPGALAAAAAAVSAPVWERRADHADALRLCVGAATTSWPVGRGVDGTRLGPVPLVVDLAERHAVGLVGSGVATRAVARWLVAQAVALHGPSDLVLAAAVHPGGRGPDDPGERHPWAWLRWLPHLRDRTGLRRVATSVDEVEALAAALADELAPAADGKARTAPVRPARFGLVLVTAPELARARALREQVLRPGSALRAVVLADATEDLPAWCDVVLEVGLGGAARLVGGEGGGDGAVATGVDEAWAEALARSLGRLDDPDRAGGGAGVPTRVPLVALLGIEGALDDDEELTARVLRRWDAGGGGLAAPVGAAEGGAFVLDLVADGPHALVAGTTGAGKSELLRSWVAGMAVGASPDEVNLILVDFKGGGAFDACAALPHTVAVITDLDAHLAARALRCLRAEVRHREGLLRAVGASDLAGYRAAGPAEPLARLVVVVDEFATLAAELPDFVASVVDVAQRGRSLGIHLVLATQRPSGVVDTKVRANTNLRVALRMQDDADSFDVLGCADAARLTRRTPGRALARLGSGEVALFQAALVSAHTPPPADRGAVTARPFTLWGDGDAGATGAAPGGATDLQRLVVATTRAAQQRGCRAPRVPWPAPLPERVDAVALWADAPPDPGAVPLGLADEPDDQRQSPWSWRVADGNLLVLGANGAHTSRALATVALGLAARHGADEAHLYVIDGGSGTLAPLGELAHCGAYASGADTARTARVLEVLTDELDRRRALVRQHGGGAAGRPLVVLVVENAGAVLDALEADGERDAVGRAGVLVRDGAALGVHAVLAVPHERALPGRLTGLVPQRLVLRMAEATSYLALGLAPRDLPTLRGLRGVVAPAGLEVQVAEVADVADAVRTIGARTAPAARPPAPVRTLPSRIGLADLAPATGRLGDDVWSLPVALTPSLRPVHLEMPAGIHAVVAGPPGSGRSSTLVTVAHAALAATGGDVRLVVVAPRRSPLARLGGGERVVDDADGLEAALAAAGNDPCLVLVDDAELVSAPLGQALARLADAADDRRRIVAAGRADALRSVGAWTASLRHGRTGVALQPATGDGDVFRTALPGRMPLPPAPGRGYVISLGTAQLAQLAAP